ncbi:ATP-dependent RecD-like DNA helicase [Mycoplasmopsis anatis]|uniref:AAA family ATPase n=2 Tax=Mycoplasmopsis anatis TaxID=171279 RepID=UPI001C4E114F|nr:AAA family ATPase [Mycoplasmopsis anatis]MBW0594325.1 ATP-dependent RecD-like DNA helicase [Mycoplasmopsis anatis]MBW0595148.1 ATP-dependent RecD-like DNA helicase [Mycoplasmopsis anatis]MBW0597917.1 ATP-dependent RecD-like DNA helicase [Mycoplasmopsis anatis]MBW0598704.1 ATP-dependent RecD-like DNA helicase [Mycoplasmopsis anatis]MBW0601014.1 ATP-dependent RecD-like DNA helicase [Mycoplasmopsis anatis]
MINIIGKFIKYIMKHEGGNYALLTFKSFKEGKVSENYTVYCTHNIPELHKMYSIWIEKNQKYEGRYTLVKFEKVLNESYEIYDFLLENNVNKITIKHLKDTYADKLFVLFQNEDVELISDLRNNFPGVYDLLKANLEMLNEQKIFEENGLTTVTDYIKNRVFNNPNAILKNEFIRINPYKLVYDHPIPIVKLDELVRLLEIKNSDELINLDFERICAYIYSLISYEQQRNNDTFYDLEKIYNKSKNYAAFDIPIFNEAIEYGIEKKYFLVEQINSNIYISLLSTKDEEETISEIISRINSSELFKLNVHQQYLNQLDESQKNAFSNVWNSNITIISGAPGTGKTFLIAKIIENLKHNNLTDQDKVLVLAPTGRAASNVSLKAKVKCKTIHSYLKIDEDDADISTNVDELNEKEVLIIDEFSMVNQKIFYKLLYNSKNIRKIILIGDINQLPSISCGNLLKDFIDSKVITTCFLTLNHRSEYKEIPKHFNAIINTNKNPSFDQEVVKIIETNDDNFNNTVVEQYLKKVKEFSLDDVVILIPTYKTEFGINQVNNLIQDKVNPKGKIVTQITNGQFKIEFRVGDKVIQTENRYEDNVFNGDIGYITNVENTLKKSGESSKHGKKITVDFKSLDGEVKRVTYNESAFKTQVSLAYAITIHKFQGSESDCVIFPFNPSFDFMLNKKLIYTAVSRARKNLIIIGDYQYYINKVSEEREKEIKVNTKMKNLLIKGFRIK